MLIYLSTNENYYSKLARFLFKEPVSHIGLGFNISGVPMVIDCTKPYGKLYHLKHWESKYTIVYYAGILLEERDEIDAFQKASEYSVLKPYDWSAYFYGLFIGMLWRLHLTALPEKNFFNIREWDLCTEVLNPLKNILFSYGIDIRDIDLSARTPHMIATEIYKQTLGNERVKWYGFPDQETT